MEQKRPGVFAVIGEDARQKAAADYLGEKGFEVCGPEGLPRADWVLLPMPLTADGAALEQLLKKARPGTAAFGGRVSDGAKAAAAAAGIELADYLGREELARLNAIPTAEGCIGILLERRVRTLWDAPVLVTGYGPVGQALAVRLTALGAHVTVAARRASQRALARSQGAHWVIPLEELTAAAPGFDAVVNTIPALVLTRPVLAALRPGSLIVDLASRPGGTDFAAAAALGHTALPALSLPVRCAPESAGEYVANTVLEIIRERVEQEAAG